MLRASVTTVFLLTVVFCLPAYAIGLIPTQGNQYILNNSIYNVPIGIGGGAEVRNNVIVNASSEAIHNSGEITGNCSHNQAFGGSTSVDAQCTNTLTSNPVWV